MGAPASLEKTQRVLSFEALAEGPAGEAVSPPVVERAWWMRVGDARLQVTMGRAGDVTLDVQRGFCERVQGKTESVGSETED